MMVLQLNISEMDSMCAFTCSHAYNKFDIQNEFDI